MRIGVRESLAIVGCHMMALTASVLDLTAEQLSDAVVEGNDEANL
jgi:hypothetical protein